MSFGIVAAIGGGVLGAAGSAIGGLISSGGAKSAANTQAAAADRGIDEQRRQFDAFQKILQPFVQAGGPQGALGEIQDLMGLGEDRTPIFKDGRPATEKEIRQSESARAFGIDPSLLGFSMGETTTAQDRQQSAYDQISNSPQLQSQFQMGEDAILQNASATGGLRGGNIQGALAQYRPAMLQNAINQRFNRLSGLLNIGQSSAAGVGAAGLQMGGNISGLLQNQGQAIAQGQLGSANAIGGAFGNIFGGIGQIGSQLGGMHLGSKALGGPGIF